MSGIDDPNKREQFAAKGPDTKRRTEVAPGIEVVDSIRAEHLARTARQNAERRLANEKKDGENISALHQQLGIKNPDQMREDVIQKALVEGGARLHTSVPQTSSPDGYPGFKSLNTRLSNWDTPAGTISVIQEQLRAEGRHENINLSRELEGHGLTEIIDIRRKLTPEYQTITIPGKAGFLGIGGTEARSQRRATGRYEQPIHSQMVTGGKNEPAVRFTYFADSRDMGPNMGWKDYSGREGQMLQFEIVLPESVAKDVEKQIAADPGFMRTLVERYAKEKTLKDPNAWEAPQGQGDTLRPPYERWDAKTGGKIYVQKEGDTPGWHNENVRQVKKTP